MTAQRVADIFWRCQKTWPDTWLYSPIDLVADQTADDPVQATLEEIEAAVVEARSLGLIPAAGVKPQEVR